MCVFYCFHFFIVFFNCFFFVAHRDKALQNFHTLKIREINKIIRELWQLIYKGQDIDSIEIESGQEEGAAASKNSRSYNYRVVMRKGG
mgnify:CR=1 FL=1